MECALNIRPLGLGCSTSFSLWKKTCPGVRVLCCVQVLMGAPRGDFSKGGCDVLK